MVKRVDIAEKPVQPSVSGGASGVALNNDDVPLEVCEASESRQAAYFADTQRKLIEAIYALMPGRDEKREVARSKNPKLYIEQLHMIGAMPGVVEDAVVRYAMATEMNWVWTQQNIPQSVIDRYKQTLLAKYHDIYQAHPPDENNPELNKQIGCTIYSEVMERVSHIRTYDDALWVDGTSEGQMQHFANGEEPEPEDFVKWHPAYDQEVGE